MADTDTSSDNGQIPEGSLSEIGPEDFVKLMSEVSDEQIAEMMSGENRDTVLDEIFDRMAEHVEADKVGDTNATIVFKITGKADGGSNDYAVKIANGGAEVSEPSGDADVTITTDPVSFLNLAAGKANGPSLFMSGKLKLEGDLMLAQRMTSFFRIPTAKED